MDRISDRLLRGPLGALLGLGAVSMLATWVPHYLVWPWWSDTEIFVVTARSWDRGVLPYRDLADFNFPGATYSSWLIGKLFGWGSTTPVHAVDVLLLAALGLALAGWARARFGAALPGLAAYVLVLGFYLRLDYSQVAQRDWHATLFAMYGLLSLQACPGRAARLGSAIAFACSLAYRPYALLCLPAFLSGVDEAESGGASSGNLGTVAAWGLVTLALTALAFAPLLLAGLFDDFLRGLAYLRPGGSYNQSTLTGFLGRLAANLVSRRFLLAASGMAVVRWVGPPRARRGARTWLLALAGTALYRPLSPIDHEYLTMPMFLVSAVAAGYFLGVVVASRLSPSVRAAWLLGGLGVLTPGIPSRCDVAWSLRGWQCLVRGTAPDEPPPGCAQSLPVAVRPGARSGYAWSDYRRVLEHLRAHTGEQTYVANLLRRQPFPAINGPVDRRTPFPTAHGVVWMMFQGPAMETAFARGLAEASDCVVVWVPDELPATPALELPQVTRHVRERFRPEARFGAIEVWRRVPESSRRAVVTEGDRGGLNRGGRRAPGRARRSRRARGCRAGVRSRRA